MASCAVGSLLWRSHKILQVFGANTDVGKTVFTTLLCTAAKKQWADEAVTFVKPVSTGPDHEADDRCVSTAVLFQYGIPVSPHLAAKSSAKSLPADHQLLAQCHRFAADVASQNEKGWLFLETAGGVHSPTPSGTTQADLYTPLRVPAILVGDSRLGGISQTISAFESLHVRGYEVASVLLFDEDRYGNLDYLTGYLQDRYPHVQVAGVPAPPARDSRPQQDDEAMRRYYHAHGTQGRMARTVLERLSQRHEDRVASLKSMGARAHRSIWWPFTQQSLLQPGRITVIDSAHGDYFQTLVPPSPAETDSPSASSSPPQGLLRSSFDGSASWWTQGLGHGNPRLTLAAAHAAGRYGHVMFAEAVHRPALELAEMLLRGVANPRLTRVFFSDNGSTGTEVAIKMALRAARLRYPSPDDATQGGRTSAQKLGILGLQGGYHGDTMGAMDAAEPCAFNEKTEWYQGRGYWFAYPTVLCVDGQWQTMVPRELAAHLGGGQVFASLQDIFDVAAREARDEHLVYEAYIQNTLQNLCNQGHRFGAVLLEPVVLGAGGMALVDPLFQRALVHVVRRSPGLFRGPSADGSRGNGPESADTPHAWTGLPVVFDEVFTGIYRLGRFTAASFLGVHPDISVHAKLLTGGLVPLCTTLASESIFEAFSRSHDKTDALLHGHSYTAHPIGCQVAVESLKQMRDLEESGRWDWAKSNGWMSRVQSQDQQQPPPHNDTVWSVWPLDLVIELSRQTSRVQGAWALGSVLAIHLRDHEVGYSSHAAVSLRDALLDGSDGGAWNVHCRVLGNVLYLMAGQTTAPSSVDEIARLLRQKLL